MLKHRLVPFVHSLVFLTLLGAGCGKKDLTFDDDEGNFTTDGSGNLLSTPYALGTKVTIRVAGDSAAFAGWRIESSAATVLSVDKISTDMNGLLAECTAAAEGDTNLRLLDDTGAERRAATVTVKTPDGIRLYASGLLRLLDSENPVADGAEVQEMRVLTGGKGVFAVGYFRGGERLFGHGILELQTPTGVTATRQTSSSGRVNEWLFLNPASDGTTQVQLKHRGNVLRTISSVAVPESQVTSASLSMQQAAHLDAGAKPWVLLRAKDASGRDVHGVYATWTLDGATQTGDQITSGDLYRLDYLAGTSKQLVATHGTLTAMTTVEAGSGHVFESTYLGCHVLPGARAQQLGLAPVLLISAMTAWLLRRRRSLVRSASA